MGIEPRCPRCGGEMTAGSAGVMSFTAGLTWHKERSVLARHAETLVSAPLGGMIWLDGSRCPSCRLLQVQL